MRSSKTRSRSKSNRNNNRSMGNIVNRVFDSSGPEGKVRGTPQQIIDKYNQLARDAQLSNDRVAFENFQQHAEHYTRMLSEAMREQEARREQQEREQAQRREQQQQDRGDRDNRNENRNENRGDNRDNRDDRRSRNDRNDGNENAKSEQPRAEQPRTEPEAASDVIDTGTSADNGLVETPESKPARPRRSRKPKPPVDESTSDKAPAGGPADTPEAAE